MNTEDNIQTNGQPETQAPSFLDKLRANTPAVVTDNAPRVVSLLKVLGCTSMLFSKNIVFSVAGACAITGHAIAGIFAKKKSEEEKERLRKEEEAKQPESQNAVSSHLHKVFNPSKYPIESGASVAAAASVLWSASGIFGKGGFSPGRLIGGGLSFIADANVALKKERIGEVGANPHKEGSINYYVTEMKNRPVLLSSMLNLTCDVAMIAGGAHEKFWKGKEANTLMAGLFLMSANVFQAIFVNKNDYNIVRKAGAAPQPTEAQQVVRLSPEAKKEIAW